MKKLMAFFVVFACLPVALAADNAKEVDRVKDSGVVLKEILNIPDDIPSDLLDDAECVIVLPSVKKLAIGIGGSFGRGVMVCRSGEHFTRADLEDMAKRAPDRLSPNVLLRPAVEAALFPTVVTRLARDSSTPSVGRAHWRTTPA